jgi:outer membrane protein assembly factor BamB
VTDNYIYLASDDGSVRVYEINDSDKGHPYPDPIVTTPSLGDTIKASPVVTTNTSFSGYTERVYVTLNNGTNGGCYWYEYLKSSPYIINSGSWQPPGSGYTLQGIAAADGWLTFGNDNKKVFAATGF